MHRSQLTGGVRSPALSRSGRILRSAAGTMPCLTCLHLQNASVPKSAHKGHGTQMLSAIQRSRDGVGAGVQLTRGPLLQTSSSSITLPTPMLARLLYTPLESAERSAGQHPTLCNMRGLTYRSCLIPPPRIGTIWTDASDSVTALPATPLLWDVLLAKILLQVVGLPSTTDPPSLLQSGGEKKSLFRLLMQAPCM